MVRPILSSATLLLCVGCSNGLQKSAVGSYVGFFAEFEFTKEGTFTYGSIPYDADPRVVRLTGTFTETFDADASDDDSHFGQIDLTIGSIVIDGSSEEASPFGVTCPNFCDHLVVGEINSGWWVHDLDLSSDNSEMGIHINPAGEPRGVPYGNRTIWYANPE